MGSPLATVGVINADVSTCVAGWLGRRPDVLPVRMTVKLDPGGNGKTFNVDVVRQRSLVASLVQTVLTNAVDMEGDLPEELTAELQARIEIENHEPILIQDTFSGTSYSGLGAPKALYNQIAGVIDLLMYNSYQPVRIDRIECETRILPAGARPTSNPSSLIRKRTHRATRSRRPCLFGLTRACSSMCRCR